MARLRHHPEPGQAADDAGARVAVAPWLVAAGHSGRRCRPARRWRLEGAGMVGDPVLALAVRLLVLVVVLALLWLIVRGTRRR